jgi:hypothetical protein
MVKINERTITRLLTLCVSISTTLKILLKLKNKSHHNLWTLAENQSKTVRGNKQKEVTLMKKDQQERAVTQRAFNQLIKLQVIRDMKIHMQN